MKSTMMKNGRELKKLSNREDKRDCINGSRRATDEVVQNNNRKNNRKQR